MSLTFAAALEELNTTLGDPSDITFSTSEKERAMTRAWNDSHVFNEVWDTSVTYSTGTYQYTRPAALTGIADIYISVSGASNPHPEPIDNSLWEDVNGKIQFNSAADRVIPHGYTLYIKGRYKLSTSDSIAGAVMQEYVLALAGVYTLKMLLHKKANLFTKNDVTVSELINIRRDLENDVVELRRRLRTSWESV